MRWFRKIWFWVLFALITLLVTLFFVAQSFFRVQNLQIQRLDDHADAVLVQRALQSLHGNILPLVNTSSIEAYLLRQFPELQLGNVEKNGQMSL